MRLVARSWIVFAVLFAAVQAPAFADGAKPAWAGVWRGTIGHAEVQVCLQHEDYDDFGAYYYLRHLAIISLGKIAPPAGTHAKPGEPPVWTEAGRSDRAAKAPQWKLDAITRGHLQGVWSDGATVLPIDLVSVAMTRPEPDENDTPCGNMAFSRPRFTRPAITTRPAMLKHVAYTRVIADPGKQFDDSTTEVFQLHGTGPAIAHVNAELYKSIPTSPDDATYFSCAMAALGQNGLDGDASSTITPLIITPGWLVFQDADSSDCGGAHPNGDVLYQTWNLRRGAKVDLYDWFMRSALTQTVNDRGTKNQYTTVAFTPPFRKLIDDAYARDDADCKDAEKGADFWDARLTEKGIAFTPELAHVETACTDDSEIPFARLAPYLNAAGKAELASFLAEMRAFK